MIARPRIISVGTSVPPTRYTQEEVISRYNVQNPSIKKIFTASHINTRHLYLPEPGPDGIPKESQTSSIFEMASLVNWVFPGQLLFF